MSAQLQSYVPEYITKSKKKMPTVSAQLLIPSEQLIDNLSYSKFKLLVDLDNETKRAFLRD